VKGRVAAAAALLALFATVPVAAAKTYAPNKFKDHVADGCSAHDCTLREAVIAANHHSGRDTIVLKEKGPYFLQLIPGGMDGEKTGDLNINDPVVIEHNGGGLATIDANQVDRAIFQKTATTPEQYTKLSRIAVKNGQTNGFGGGIQLGNGLLGLDHSTVSGNQAGLDGGGIYASSGELTLTDSTISGNQADGTGGGVWSTTKTVIKGSTLSGNQALTTVSTSGGGGLFFSGPRLKMTNDTVAMNRATSGGGGIDSSGPATVNEVTVTANMSDSDNVDGGPAGGVFAHSEFAIANSIIEGNSVGSSGSAPDCRGMFTSGGYNLVNATAGCFGFEAQGDIYAPDPMLGGLKKNGGPTKTVALKTGSPAIGAASEESSEHRDQRGFSRDAHPDTGAFERGATGRG
jgi:CSLREA domain-containing protein